MAKRGELIVGLDIGTTKICAIVGEVTETGSIDIIGIGSHPSKGLRKGVVINIDSTVGSIKKAIEEAELMAGCEISTVYAGIAGGHIKGINSHGVVAVKDKEITKTDVDRVIDAAKAIAIPMDREVIHILPQEFIVDDQDGIREPIGMSGVRLEAQVHIVTGAVSSAQNIIKCANRCGLNVADIALEQLASSEAVLTDDEKELGVALVDIGGGTTDIAIFSEGAIVHTSVLAVGGNHLTNDVAVGLRTPTHEAEKIKQQLRLRHERHGRPRGDHRGPQRRRPAAAGALPADPLRDHRASRGRAVHAGAARAPEVGLRGPAGQRRGHHRRLHAARGDARARRGRAGPARCGAGCPGESRGWSMWSGARCTPPAWAWCSTAARTPTPSTSGCATRTSTGRSGAG